MGIQDKQTVKGGISVQIDNDVREFLERLEPHQVKDTLGIFVAVGGYAIDEVNHLLIKIRKMAEYLRTAKIDKREA